MPGRNKRRHFDFSLGAGVSQMEYADLLVQAHVSVQLAKEALMDAERREALARLSAALEALSELRHRGDQLRLWQPPTGR